MTKIASPDNVRWPGIKPGDIGWDEGGGLVGLGIRAVTLGAYAHCFVYTKQLDDDTFETVEAYPGGVKLRTRSSNDVYRVVRLWRTPEAQQRMVDEALSHVGRRYAYGELLGIALGRLGLPFEFPDHPETMICSNSCARVALQGDIPVERWLSWSPDRIWPARLERDLNVASWNHYVGG